MGRQLYTNLVSILNDFRINKNLSNYIKNLIHIVTTIKRKIEGLLNIFCWRCNSINVTIGLFWYRLYTNSRQNISLIYPLQFKFLSTLENKPYL